ncbi:MAG: phosphoribosyl-AMP cyclohydrolase [Omnitrophica WOR_2 bacterium GWA2_47_8]|nr:MAG: phosphoribosyl-AMP cyclohydrolase [Omnitrophica WOR_2 bacterium GWA2_47_8]
MSEKNDKESLDFKITADNLKDLKFASDGLIPAIVQDEKTKEVLMMAYMNIDSLKETIKGGKTCFWSRSRKEYWVKGMTSGHFQFVKDIYFDCDCDTLLITVEQVGAACHTNRKSCFYRKIKTK